MSEKVSWLGTRQRQSCACHTPPLLRRRPVVAPPDEGVRRTAEGATEFRAARLLERDRGPRWGHGISRGVRPQYQGPRGVLGRAGQARGLDQEAAASARGLAQAVLQMVP